MGMWWWGPCAGSACCTVDVVAADAHAPRSAAYDELMPLTTDRNSASMAPPSSSGSPSTSQSHQRRQSIVIDREEIAPGIYRARDARTRELVALKVFRKAILRHPETRRRLRQEIRMLELCKDQPNILQLYDVYASKDTFEIVFELARGGQVMNRVLSATTETNNEDEEPIGLDLSIPTYHFSEREVSRVIASMVSAVQFLHAQGIVHGELRPEHVLYADAEPDARVLLVDFGRAAPWKSFAFRSRLRSGLFLWDEPHSRHFLPPFVLERSRRVSRTGDESDLLTSWKEAQQIDTWSIGVTMYMMLCAQFPFNSPSSRGALRFPHGSMTISRAARDLLTRLLETDPSKAMSIDEVCDHPWVSSQVAPDIAWGPECLYKHKVFATEYAQDIVLPSSQPTTDDEIPKSNTIGSFANSEVSPAFTYEGVERPSFVSTDGNIQVSSPGDTSGDDRLSADAYMRLASVEMDAAIAQQPPVDSPLPIKLLLPQISPSSTSSGKKDSDEYEDRMEEGNNTQQILPTTQARRLFTFKSLSFQSKSSSEDGK
ncbi:hypothetical protein Poli38472_011921 [Pythium oligandrum]|uniref:Protein kinase domain-containing protein n=1 Tax=Pythium oligandrum TaxID=41045 RepID=A0A8K1FH22_PYTOL|nr:hypothetical protein Poli38472_011921 [Pythium oligandrum]|eukprot:TMW58333.1 hypothetical protein Poli38472_011921 [Pythium oligandrum]